MRVQVVGAATDGPGFPLSTFVFDGVLAVDAGALGWFSTPDEQARIRNVLITHSHIDHLAGLPIFLDNIYRLAPTPPCIHLTAPTLSAIRDHLFNDLIVPDFIRFSEIMPPFLIHTIIHPEKPFLVEQYEITAFELDHVVPTVGFRIDDGKDVIAIVTDTAPIPEVLTELARVPRLRAVFLEASFPNSHGELANASKHLTVDQFLEGAALFPKSVAVFAIHVKPRFYREIREVIQAARMRNVFTATPGQIVNI